MSFAKKVAVATEYQGESFTRTLTRDNGSVWDATHGGTFAMYNTAGVEVATGALIKSADELGLTFKVDKTDTADLDGDYLLLATLTDSSDPEFSDVIAEYTITYIVRKAG